MQQVYVLISGRVQGVFYRSTCQEVASRLGLTGWVRNLSTGQVEILAQGEKEKVEKLITWCKKGSPSAVVNNVKVEWQEPEEDFKDFQIK